jgi:hypothetical protein
VRSPLARRHLPQERVARLEPFRESRDSGATRMCLASGEASPRLSRRAPAGLRAALHHKQASHCQTANAPPHTRSFSPPRAWASVLSPDEGGGAPRGAGADRRTVTCHDAARLDAMTRHPAPSDVGRTPFGAPPRHFSDPDRTCALSSCLESRSASDLARPARSGRRVDRGARVRDCKSRPQEPLPAPPASVPPEDALSRAGMHRLCLASDFM